MNQPLTEAVNPIPKKENRPVMERGAARVLAGGCLLAAVVYSICFTGVNVLPQASSFVFCVIFLALYAAVLGRLGYIRNRRALLMAVPICLIAGFNALFELSVFTYFNVPMLWLLFLVMSMSATRERGWDFDSPSYYIDLVGLLFCGFGAIRGVIAPALPSGKGSGTGRLRKVLAGIVLALPVAALILALMLDADAVFSTMMGGFFDRLADWDFSLVPHVIAVGASFMYCVNFAYNLRSMRPSSFQPGGRKADTLSSVTFLTILNGLFLVFCVVQVAYLFMGGFGRLPEGVIYSEYAREGFFQLLFITLINFSIMLAFLKIFPSTAERPSVRWLLVLLCAFTAVLICSSFYRMSLYIQAYGFTRLRLMVLTFLTMEAVLIPLTVLHIFKPGGQLLRRYATVGLLFYLLVNVTSSGWVSTRLNIARFERDETYGLDISDMGTDSAGLLVDLRESGRLETSRHANLAAEIDARLRYFGEGDSYWQNETLIWLINKDRSANLLEGAQ